MRARETLFSLIEARRLSEDRWGEGEQGSRQSFLLER